MHSKAFVMAKKYYDQGLWQEFRIRALVEKGKLTSDEYTEITGQDY